jgi:dCTP deaminase
VWFRTLPVEGQFSSQMILSDKDIRRHLQEGSLVISPIPEDSAFQPASVDLSLGIEFVDVNGKKLDYDKELILNPNQFILGCTKEWLEIPNFLVGILDGKSTIARKGIMIHVIAGFLDPGWKGVPTLEIKNLSNKPFVLVPDSKICQVHYQSLSSPSLRKYGDVDLNSHYQGSTSVRKSYG